MPLKKFQNIDLAGKKVILRVDLNLPMKGGVVQDKTRALAVIPTIKALQEKQAKIILVSHFGRPKGKIVHEMSLRQIMPVLEECLQEKVQFCADFDEVRKSTNNIILIENIRFYAGEEKNDPDFAKELASLGDVYINDSFSSSHRSHSSITGITQFLPSYAGLLMQQEIESLEAILTSPKKPLIAIVGGSKVSTKIGLLHNLVKTADILVIAGAMANSFLKAKNVSVGKSLYEAEFLEQSKEILKLAEENNCKITLPVDGVLAKELKDNVEVISADVENIPDDYMMLDIGPKTVSSIIENIQAAKTCIWNGPLGAFEFAPFCDGTSAVGRAVVQNTKAGKLVSVAGGGDIIAALSKSGLDSGFTYISTAGGAFLEWLEGVDLPGVKMLYQVRN